MAIIQVRINIDNFIAKVLTFLVIVYPLLSVYGINQINLGMVSMFLFILVIILTIRKIEMKWPKYFWMFFVYMVFSRFFSSENYAISSLFSMNLFSFAIIIGFSFKYFNLPLGLKIYEISVLICCFFFFLQELMYFTLGTRIVGLLPWIPLNTGMASSDYISWLRYNSRSASFFLEPAHFAQFIIPLLALELFKTQKTKMTIFYILVISVVILLLKSGTGILVVTFIYII